MSKISKDLKIEIRPIPNRNGIQEYGDNLEYFSQPHIIAPFVNPVSLKYETGLDEEDVKYLKDNNFPYNIDDNYDMRKAHEFWESQIVKTELVNSPIFLYPGKNLLDFVKWKYLLVNEFIYNSEAEMMTGSKTKATHYIYNQSEEMSLQASKLERKNKLVKAVSELTLAKKRQIVLIIEDENTDNKNEDYLTVKLDNIINDKEKSFILEGILSQTPEKTNIKAEIKSAIRKNVLVKNKQGIFYFDTNLGFSQDDVEEFLLKPENQELYLNIKKKIEK